MLTIEASTPAQREIVACLIRHQGRLLLLRRSLLVSEPGFWHCVTGYWDSHPTPLSQARAEILEETGLTDDVIRLVCSASAMTLVDEWATDWRVHAFEFESLSESIVLNWEHDDAAWVSVESRDEFATVPWFSDVEQLLNC